MWFPVAAWIVLLIASAFFAGATLDLDPAQISIHFRALPGPQRFALAAIILTTLSLIGSSVWQAYSLARQNKLLRDRLKGLRGERRSRLNRRISSAQRSSISPTATPRKPSHRFRNRSPIPNKGRSSSGAGATPWI
jgi:hypothetical protein